MKPGVRKEILGKDFILLEHFTVPKVIIVLCTSWTASATTPCA
jgi:hypothetical protein